MKWVFPLTLGLLAPLLTRAAEAWDERVADSLAFATSDGSIQAQGSGFVSVTGYKGDQSIPGMVFSTQDPFFSPRLTLFVDGRAGSFTTGFLQARIDRGFDPTDGSAQVRLDEYAVRFGLGSSGRCNLQVGKFATVIGNWVPRHDEWQNPFVGAPLPYEYVTGIYDRAAAVSPKDLVIDGEEEDYEYNPIIWGPSYSTGMSFSGRNGRFDYAVEVKNGGPSSRPESWSWRHLGFAHPAYSARVGFRPDMRFNLGFSASESVYLLPVAARTIPPGARLGDYRERLFGQDFSFEWHQVQLWAELFEAEFDLPQLGRARSLAGYVEIRYKLTTELSTALRINRQVFSTIDDAGVATPWGENLTRVDGAMLYRFSPAAQLKLQASAKQTAEDHHPRLSYAAQLTLRF